MYERNFLDGMVSGAAVLAWLLTCFAAGDVCAQDDGAGALRNPAEATYDVVALRVEFQPDTTRFTTGNGTFDGSIYDTMNVSIDPLPHDAGYFRSHLRFLRDYVRTVSDGRTKLRTHLISEIVRMPREMGYYSPTGAEAGSPEERQKLARLVRDAWSRADREVDFSTTGLDPDRTAFVLFHAGAGRDIELIGTSLANTPEDIPSLYMDRFALGELLGAYPTFKGMTVDHTMILPETESRIGTNPLTEEPYVAEFSINGMLAATFFNYLGVPDLYNTTTGESGIGPFGLMDPLGIFAYNGLFPPEPTAWTKYYLGWIEPNTVSLTEAREISLTAVADTASSDAVLVRVSEAEYFLVENRHRDPEMDGLRLRVRKEGALVTQEIPAGTEDFTRFDPAAFTGGVVVGVDAYDWAIPGGTIEDGTVQYGGAAVWHINERKIRAGLASNTVNTDPRNRGVDLEEADGADDFGFASESILGGGNEQGTPFDLFFEGNPVRVETESGEEVSLYTNRFGPDSYPSSSNAAGGPSFVSLREFSDPGREMRLTARRTGAAGMKPVRGLRSGRLAESVERDVSVSGVFETDSTVYVAAGDTLHRFSNAADTWSHTRAEWSFVGKPVGFEGGLVGLVPPSETGGSWSIRSADSTFAQLPDVAGEPVGAPVVVRSSGEPVLYAAFGSPGQSTLIRWNGREAVRVADETLPAAIVGLAAGGDGRLVVVGRTGTVVRGGSMTWSHDLESGEPKVAFGRDERGLMGVVVTEGDHRLLVLGPDGSVRELGRVATGRDIAPYPVLSDLDDDGLLDVLVPDGDRLIGRSRTGAVVEGFPISLPAAIDGRPLVVRFGPDDPWTVVAGADDGFIYGYEVGRAERNLQRFPVSVGFSVPATPLIRGSTMLAVSASAGLRAWRFSEVDSVAWGELHGDLWNRQFVEVPSSGTEDPDSAVAGDLLVGERTYNWPNPVRTGTTHFRFVVRSPADVRITIVDMAGGLVKEIDVGEVPAGAPYEVSWNTKASSGVYYARVEATGENGRSDTELITVAVVR